ncbi:hypothetical protein AAG570_009330 [Ranatra chinensis]|uniref:Cytochrome P450 n=1 Tax=Ranatra chinensis TaxID=642074 RepID=A0ABD0YNR6_9HEMI
MVEASYDNFGNVLGSMFRLLSLHQDVQSKLGKEIEEVLKKHSNKINMESIKEMKYLTMVLSETLRCFPTLARMERTCTKDYTFPTGLTIEKNTRVNVPLYGLHNDPKYYPNPEKFDPERFTENAKSERPPYVYLPFGNGPRKCVGMYNIVNL